MGWRKYSFMAESRREERLTPWKYSWYQKLTCSRSKYWSVINDNLYVVSVTHLVKLFHVQGFIGEGCNVEISPEKDQLKIFFKVLSSHAPAGEHSAPRFQELLSVQERLQHPLVEQHVAHRLGYDDVHLNKK